MNDGVFLTWLDTVQVFFVRIFTVEYLARHDPFHFFFISVAIAVAPVPLFLFVLG